MRSALVRGLMAVLAVTTVAGLAAAGTMANFDNLTLSPAHYWNGSDSSGGFTSGLASFNNLYTIDSFSGWAFWGGWAYSNVQDSTTPGYGNQYAAAAGGAKDGSNYGIGYVDAFYGTTPGVTFAAPTLVTEAWFTNTTYAYMDMLNGSDYSKKFGGDAGTDSDWFLLTITGVDAAGRRSTLTGLDSEGNPVGTTVLFYLADLRSSNPAEDYILHDWTRADLSGLGAVKSLEFTLTSSDNSDWGMNTPSYFAMDAMTPEPATLAMLGVGLAAVWARKRKENVK
jgi:hypothetical protein